MFLKSQSIENLTRMSYLPLPCSLSLPPSFSFYTTPSTGDYLSSSAAMAFGSTTALTS